MLQVACSEVGSSFIVTKTFPNPQKDLTNELQYDVPYYDKQMQCMIIKRLLYGDLRTWTFYFFKIDIVLHVRDKGCWINWYAYIPHKYEGKTLGLLGNFDGNFSNDFRLKNEEVLPSSIDMPTLYNHYKESCKFNFSNTFVVILYVSPVR